MTDPQLSEREIRLALRSWRRVRGGAPPLNSRRWGSSNWQRTASDFGSLPADITGTPVLPQDARRTCRDSETVYLWQMQQTLCSFFVFCLELLRKVFFLTFVSLFLQGCEKKGLYTPDAWQMTQKCKGFRSKLHISSSLMNLWQKHRENKLTQTFWQVTLRFHSVAREKESFTSSQTSWNWTTESSGRIGRCRRETSRLFLQMPLISGGGAAASWLALL